MSSPFEKDLLEEVNALRRNPKGYSEKLVKNKAYFKGLIWKHPEAKFAIKTQEGAAAYDEAINYLKVKAISAPELTPSKGLCKIASDFLKDFQKDEDSNSDLDSVIGKYGTFSGNFKRFVQFGGFKPDLVVINLLVSDGDKKRGYREALLLKDLTKVGVANGPHDKMRAISVIVAASTFDNTVDSNDTI